MDFLDSGAKKKVSWCPLFNIQVFWPSSASEILEALLDWIKVLNFSVIAPISMDPVTNLKLFESFKMHHSKCELPKRINNGIYRLHVVHGAFESGTEVTS